ncbi:MAG TPA: hypothetical protein VFV10_13295 [Gammaproteobacteria bacterium]|nr:hypothetical protein [Gammaproteobacteria bacterium]
MGIDRRDFIASLGGAAAVGLMSHEARADALEDRLMAQVRETPSPVARAEQAASAPPSGASAASPAAQEKFPTAAEVEAQINTRSYRRGVGNLFLTTEAGRTVEKLEPMPGAPTLFDFFDRRFMRTRNHCLQSANKAMQRGADEEIVLACLLHDTVQEIMKSDHGYWGAQMYEPYVPERTAFAIRYHQALRFYPDEKAGYVYPDLYKRVFGVDYVPAPHVQAAYEYVRKHRWYDAPREVTVSDLYAFDPKAVVPMDEFVDIVNRHFRQPKEGLGNDASPVAHMWRTIANPDAPL